MTFSCPALGTGQNLNSLDEGALATLGGVMPYDNA